jgi:hypothetical protein
MGSPKVPIPLGPLAILLAMPIRFRRESVVTATFILNCQVSSPSETSSQQGEQNEILGCQGKAEIEVVKWGDQIPLACCLRL